MSTATHGVAPNQSWQGSKPQIGVHDIPPELWALIFETIIHSDDTTPSRVLLLHICRFLRQIALTTPQLWTTLRITARSDAQQVNFFLQKSTSLPVDVFLNLYLYNLDNRVADLLHAHLHRLQTFELRARDRDQAQKVLSMIGRDQPAPFLKRLSVRVTKPPRRQYDAQTGFSVIEPAFSAAPVLDTLMLPLCHLPSDKNIIFSPSLTHLILDQPTYFFPSLNWEWIFSAFKAIRNLQSFTFNGPTTDVRTSPGNILNSFHSQSLTSIDMTAPGYGLSIIRTLTAPLLKKVRIDALGQRALFFNKNMTDRWTAENGLNAMILSILSRRSPCLTHIELCGIDMGESGAVWLQGVVFPMLEHLTLNDVMIEDFSLLESVFGSASLRVLEFVAFRDISAGGLFSFVTNRQPSIQVVLRACPDIEDTFLENLSDVAAVQVISE
ncbi:hypothetical protein CPC08DRAFT_769494 [Agrocybe pediades]|nr:hypothetical protein CPC08DRAFT_769494 [Agrocybe pediades]